jgi:BASS family bile acid:Na+ symporter
MKVLSDNAEKILVSISILSLLVFLFSILSDYSDILGPSAISFSISIAFYFSLNRTLKKFAFTIWVFVFVVVSLFYPFVFDTWAGINLAILIVPLIQIIMFGMGTTLNISDFTRVLKMPKPILIGLALQFTVMPLSAIFITTVFNFDPEISAGIILVGSCPGGVASNLMAYLAGGNVALSVAMTTSSTMVSPVMTPLLMQSLAGKLVPINFIEMMMSIFNMIIVPVVAGVFANRILYISSGWINQKRNLVTVSFFLIIIGIIFIWIDKQLLGLLAPLKNGLVLGFLLLGAVAFVKFIMVYILDNNSNWMDKTLPLVSMFGICFIIGIITARSSEKLLSIGLALLAASIIHNLLGYILGYWISKLTKLDEKSCRTVAFEVGMQNGGMATGLAMNVLKSASAALPPAIFGPWMNVSGSVLATWWKRKKVKE